MAAPAHTGRGLRIYQPPVAGGPGDLQCALAASPPPGVHPCSARSGSPSRPRRSTPPRSASTSWPPSDIVDLMLAEDREDGRGRAARARSDRARRRDHRRGAAQGRPHHLRRRRHERPARRARIRRDAADLRHRPDARPGDHGRRPRRDLRAKEGVEDNYEEGARAISRAAPDQEGRRRRRVGQRHDAVRPRRADPRAQGGREDHLRHLRPENRAADLRRSHHRARRSGPRSSPGRPGSRRAPRPRWCSTC